MSKIVKINQNKRREPIKDEDLQDFEPYCVPDMERLRKLLLEGKGAERTWREYAEAMGSWSTYAPKFSRIRKSNLVRPVDKDFLRKIVDNAADFIGLDDIMRAGGWQRKKKPVEKGSFDEYIRNEFINLNRNKYNKLKIIIFVILLFFKVFYAILINLVFKMLKIKKAVNIRR